MPFPKQFPIASNWHQLSLNEGQGRERLRTGPRFGRILSAGVPVGFAQLPRCRLKLSV